MGLLTAIFDLACTLIVVPLDVCARAFVSVLETAEQAVVRIQAAVERLDD